MSDWKQRFFALAVTIVLFGLNLIALNYLIGGWSGARVDLTEERIFSISPATKRILGSLEEDVTIRGYFSKRTHPKLAPLIPEITDLLAEYRAVSRGRVAVEILDPGEDEIVEQEAADRFGVRSTPFHLASKYETGIVNAYFALVVQYGDQYERYSFQDLIDVEALPDGDIDVRLRNLEYDLTRAIKKTVFGFRAGAELFERSEMPVKLTAMISPETLPEAFSDAPEAVRKAAEELSEKGGDKFVFEEFDPSKDEELARQIEERYGFRPMSVGIFGEGTPFYLYGLLEIEGRLEQLNLTGESISAAWVREAIEDSLRRNTPGFLKTVGIFASGEDNIPPQLRMQMGMPPAAPPEFEEIKRFLTQDYEVQDVTLDEPGGVPSNVDTLLVLKPKNLSEDQLFHLDQYLMRGGRVIVCGGQYEASFAQQGLSVAPVESGLDEWLAHHGITIEKTLVLDDRNQALPIPEVRQTPLGMMRTLTMAPYPYLVQIRDDGFLQRDITATLDAMGIYWGSPLTVDDAAVGEREVIPILRSSAASWTNDDVSQAAFVDYVVPEEGLERQLLAVAQSGRFTSYYKDRPAPQPEPVEPVADELATPPPPPVLTLTESPDTRLIVVGNGEFVNDFVARAIGQLEGGFFVENLTFLQNLIDWTGQDSDMIGIRARGLASRRLDAVDKSTEITIEVVNYAIPLLLLLALGLWQFWKRKNAPSILASTSRGEA